MYDILYIDDSKIKYNEKIYNVNIAFNRMLKAIDILEDKDLEGSEKIIYLYECFVDEKYKCSLNDKAGIVNKIMEHANKFFKDRKSSDSEVLMDIKQDFEYIYSSFMMDYHIDLIDEIDKLSWIKFISLLNGFSSKTKMSEVIKIRCMTIPKPTKDNSKERENVIKLKAYYALKNSKNNFQEQLNELFGVLKTLAKK